MFLQCPGCGRQIGRRRARCIYCGQDVAAFRAQRGSEAGLAVDATSASAWAAAVLFSPSPGGTADAAALAEALGITAFDAGQLLRRAVPYAVDCADRSAADALVERVSSCGFAAVAYPQAALAEVPPARRVASVTVLDPTPGPGASPYRGSAGPRRLVMALRDGGRHELSTAGLRLTVVGELRMRRRRTAMSLLGTAARATRELSRVLDQPLAEGRSTLERRMLVDLYWQLDGDAAVPLRLTSSTTTIAGLGVRNFERTAGLGRLLVWLRRAAPACPVDLTHKLDTGRRAGGASRYSRGDATRWDRWSARAWVIAQRR